MEIDKFEFYEKYELHFKMEISKKITKTRFCHAVYSIGKFSRFREHPSARSR